MPVRANQNSAATTRWLVAVCLACSLSSAAADDGPQPFEINVVDKETGRGVPLVELRTVNNIRLYTDSAGRVAFCEPGMMGKRVYFHVSSHGYQYPKDGFGYRGVRLTLEPGGSATLQLKRLNIAERLYRVTGAGIYRDTVLLGKTPPTDQALLNGQVLGSDSVVNAVLGGKIYWFWGDTNRLSYPLGNFHVPGAVSRLPGDGGLDPDVGVDLKYFVNEQGFAKPTCKMPGAGPTWIGGLVVLDHGGRERMFAKYVKVKPPLTVYESGLVEFDEGRREFQRRVKFDEAQPAVGPGGHSLKHQVDGETYVYFPQPFPWVRVRARPDDLLDLKQYETYTCLKAGSTPDDPQLDRGSDGRLRLDWRRQAPPLTRKLLQKLKASGAVRPEDQLSLDLIDADSGGQVVVHSTSVAWNAYRQRWTMIALESFGSSPLGEIWYAEAPQPEGPWRQARKVVTHEKYSFYNPKQHPMLSRDEGRWIYFEGTYTNMFSGNPDRTPRYNYNQIMYRLDLSDPRLEREGN